MEREDSTQSACRSAVGKKMDEGVEGLLGIKGRIGRVWWRKCVASCLNGFHCYSNCYRD